MSKHLNPKIWIYLVDLYNSNYENFWKNLNHLLKDIAIILEWKKLVWKELI